MAAVDALLLARLGHDGLVAAALALGARGAGLLPALGAAAEGLAIADAIALGLARAATVIALAATPLLAARQADNSLRHGGLNGLHHGLHAQLLHGGLHWRHRAARQGEGAPEAVTAAHSALLAALGHDLLLAIRPLARGLALVPASGTVATVLALRYAVPRLAATLAIRALLLPCGESSDRLGVHLLFGHGHDMSMGAAYPNRSNTTNKCL